MQIGFNPQNLLTFRLDACQAGYKDAALDSFYERMIERFRAVPGVRAATLSNLLLVTGSNNRTGIIIPGVSLPEGDSRPSISYAAVGSQFFGTTQIPLVSGRPIDARDGDGAPPVPVVNQVFADRFLPKQNPLGRHFSPDVREKAHSKSSASPRTPVIAP